MKATSFNADAFLGGVSDLGMSLVEQTLANKPLRLAGAIETVPSISLALTHLDELAGQVSNQITSRRIRDVATTLVESAVARNGRAFQFWRGQQQSQRARRRHRGQARRAFGKMLDDRDSPGRFPECLDRLFSGEL